MQFDDGNVDGLSDGLAGMLAGRFAEVPTVVAVALGGSRTTDTADAVSDIDLYVYADGEVPVPFRLDLARSGGGRYEVDNRFWETGDEWEDRRSGMFVDIMYRDRRWIEGVIVDLLDRHRPSIGYSTCLWHNVLTSRPLFDRDGWLLDLQRRATRTYPEELAAAIVAKNHPLLDGRISSFATQIARSAARGDRIAVNHRTAAFLASYFDVLFALNRTPHPGEKRLGTHAAFLARMPTGWRSDVDRLLSLIPSGTPADLEGAARRLNEGLAPLLRAEGLDVGDA